MNNVIYGLIAVGSLLTGLALEPAIQHGQQPITWQQYVEASAANG